MNFLIVLGQHSEDIGLADLWVESGILGSNTADKLKEGKTYAKAMRVHKLTLQAIWKIFISLFKGYLEDKDAEMSDILVKAIDSVDNQDIFELTASSKLTL